MNCLFNLQVLVDRWNFSNQMHYGYQSHVFSLQFNVCAFSFVLFYNLDVTKDISDELQCDVATKEINSLCVDVDNNNFKCICYSVDTVPHDMLQHFVVFDKSKLFESVWNEICDKLDKTNITTFSDIYEHVWNETITSCRDLLYKLYKKSFNYSDIECFTDAKDINSRITAMYNAMNHCYRSLVSTLPEPKYWVPQTVKSITKYLDFITKHCKAANSNTVQVSPMQLCLKLKDLLRLKGNFSVVNTLNSQVCSYEIIVRL